MTTSPQMTNHWWWRPGWSTGKRFYTWHLTFLDQPDVHRFAGEYQHALASAGGLDLIPARWLHLTMQGIGFTEDISEATALAVAEATRPQLAALHSFGVTLGTPVVDPEAILVPVQPAQSVRDLRAAIRGAIGEVLPEVPENADGFTPHVSLAYSNSDGSAAPFAAAIADADIAPAKALISHAELILIHRDHGMYEWSSVAEIPLG
jgi:2'-5' RNA ligase